MVISRQSPEVGTLHVISPDPNWTIGEIGYMEAKLMLDSNIQASEGSVNIGLFSNMNWWLNCHITSGGGHTDNAWAGCSNSEALPDGFPVEYNSWHTLRYEINPNTAVISFFLDNQPIGSYTHSNPEAFKKAQFYPNLHVWSKDGGLVTGYVDDVRIGQFGQ